MADVKPCSKTDSHEYHPWDEQVIIDDVVRTLFHICPGVTAGDRFFNERPVDILMVPTMPEPGELTLYDKAEDQFTFDTARNAWVCPQCIALVGNPEAHEDWHKDLHRMLEKP